MMFGVSNMAMAGVLAVEVAVAEMLVVVGVPGNPSNPAVIAVVGGTPCARWREARCPASALQAMHKTRGPRLRHAAPRGPQEADRTKVGLECEQKRSASDMCILRESGWAICIYIYIYYEVIPSTHIC